MKKRQEITCHLCGSGFDPHSEPHEVIQEFCICGDCSSGNTPEESAEQLDLPAAVVYEAMGLAQEGSDNA